LENLSGFAGFSLLDKDRAIPGPHELDVSKFGNALGFQKQLVLTLGQHFTEKNVFRFGLLPGLEKFGFRGIAIKLDFQKSFVVLFVDLEIQNIVFSNFGQGQSRVHKGNNFRLRWLNLELSVDRNVVDDFFGFNLVNFRLQFGTNRVFVVELSDFIFQKGIFILVFVQTLVKVEKLMGQNVSMLLEVRIHLSDHFISNFLEHFHHFNTKVAILNFVILLTAGGRHRSNNDSKKHLWEIMMSKSL